MKKKRDFKPQHASRDPNSLFDISRELNRIIEDITEAQHAKDTDEVDKLTDDLLNLLDLHEDKYASYVHVIKNALNAAKGNQEIANEFQAIATAQNNLAKRLKEVLHADMQAHGLKQVDAGIWSVRTQKNGVPSLKIYADAEDLPEKFQKTEVDTDELRWALSHGEEVEGAKLVKGEHIRITAKRQKI